MDVNKKEEVRRMRLRVDLDSVTFRCPCGASLTGEGSVFDSWIKRHVPHTSDAGASIEETTTADACRIGGTPGVIVRPWNGQ
jgi:hypothetical protein